MFNRITGVVMFGGASAPPAMAFGLPAVPSGLLGLAVAVALGALVLRAGRKQGRD